MCFVSNGFERQSHSKTKITRTSSLKRLLRPAVIVICLLGIPAHATDYLQCKEMRRALGYVEVDGIQFAEGKFRDSLATLGLKDQCGPGWGGEYSFYKTWKEFNDCRMSWIRARYKLQGFDWKGNPIYNPAAASQFKKVRKIRLDMQKEGCP